MPQLEQLEAKENFLFIAKDIDSIFPRVYSVTGRKRRENVVRT